MHRARLQLITLASGAAIASCLALPGCAASEADPKSEDPKPAEAAPADFEEAFATCERAIDFVVLSNTRTEKAEKERCCNAALKVPLDESPPELRAESLTSRGRAKAALGDADGAEADYRAALALAPTQAEGNFRLALLLQFTREALQEAKPLYLKALETGANPKYIQGIHFNLGAIHYAAGEYEEAIASFGRSIRLGQGSPALGTAYAARANTLGRIGKHAEALADLQEALQLDPEDEPVRLAIPGCAYSAGDEALLQQSAKWFEGSPEKLKQIEVDLDARSAELLGARLERATLACGLPGKNPTIRIVFKSGTGQAVTRGHAKFSVIAQRLGAESATSLRGYVGVQARRAVDTGHQDIEVWGTVERDSNAFFGACRITDYTGEEPKKHEPFKVVGTLD